MRKLTIVLCACVSLFGMNVNAQDDSRDKLQLGIRGGLNYSNVWDEEGQDFEADPRTGFAGGAFLSIPIGTYLGIQPEVLYSQKGFQGSGVVAGTSYSFERRTNHLDVPILVQFKPIEYLTIVGGPQYSYLMSQTDVQRGEGFTSIQEQQFENDIQKNTLGAVFGADINLRNLVIAPRLGWDFQTNNGDGTSSSPRYRNQWYQITIGFRF